MSFADQLKSVRLRSSNQPKEKLHEQLLCSDSDTYRQMMNDTQFECYYDAIKQWTFPSLVLSIDEEKIKALRDGHELFMHSSLKNDDDKTEECLRRYSQLMELSKMIDSCDIPRPIFVRLSTRSPKDAILELNKDKFQELFQKIFNSLKPDHTSERNRRLIALDEATIRLLAVHDGFHAVQLLLASERIQDDLSSSSSLSLVVRQFVIDREHLKSEFRAFIFKRQFTALTQYNEYIVDRTLIENKDRILRSIRDFIRNERVLEQLPYENCVLDLILVETESNTYRVYICEINPLAEFAGTGLFSWLNDRNILLGREEFQFRIRKSETDDYPEVNNRWLSLIN